MTLNGVMALFCVISPNSVAFAAHCIKVGSMDVGSGLYMYDVVVEKFTFAISSPDEFLSLCITIFLFGSVLQIKLLGAREHSASYCIASYRDNDWRTAESEQYNCFGKSCIALILLFYSHYLVACIRLLLLWVVCIICCRLNCQTTQSEN